MTTRPQTTFAGGINPWLLLTPPPSTPATRRTPRPYQRIDLDTLGVERLSTPIAPRIKTDAVHRSVFNHLFQQLQPGEAVTCHPDNARSVAKAMHYWARANALPCRVERKVSHPDGKARVKLVPNTQATTV